MTVNPCRLVCVPALVAIVGTATAADLDSECRQARQWFATALQGERVPPLVVAAPGLDVRRQDYGKLSLRKSVKDTPIQIGDKLYKHGLGVHSVSEIMVRLPQAGTRFEAEAGVDNNWDTGGQRGSVVFIVEHAGKQAFRSDVRRGNDRPLSVNVELGGAKEFVLRVLDGGDGPGWDQCDWADASVVLADGTKLWLDELPVLTPGTGYATEIPFSFVYDGKPSAELLPTWQQTHQVAPARDGRLRHVLTLLDPATGLKVVCEATLFEHFPAVEWVLHLTNTGAADTPLLEKIQPLDLRMQVTEPGSLVLHHAHGSTCTATDFLPIDLPVQPNARLELAPHGGRSSDGRLPFFNLAWDRGGLVGAIGWSGQWAMSLSRNAGGGLALQAGQQLTHLRLHPGETIRTPRILLVMWQGDDRFHGHQLLRRLILEQYAPRIHGQLVLPEITENTWFVFNSGNDVNEQNQLAIIPALSRLGVEGYWLDAGWFEGGWPGGVGSWVPRSDAFPRGLKPLGDAAHQQKMKFIVWFEPERVSPNSRIGKEHPEFVLHAGAGDGLLNLGDPAARRWLTEHLSKCITDWGIDVYRNDFNIDPLRFWRAADAPERQGITEIRYVEGFYAYWDELLQRHPGLSIDTCASGGRRIDLEVLRRSVPLWRSDTQCCGRAMPIQDQTQTAGLSLYVPLHAAGAWSFEPYAWRSVATTGTSLCPDPRAPGFPAALAEQALREAKSLRPFYLGDYYPLLPILSDEGLWCGWQFHRPDDHDGFAVFFRRPASRYTAVDAGLRGLNDGATYQVVFAESYEPKETRNMSGAELARLRVEIGQAPGSLLVKYRQVER